MKLSKLQEGMVGKLNNNLFIVICRYPEDRISGGTEIAFSNGGRREFSWDKKDPEVELVGRGKLVTNIVLEEN